MAGERSKKIESKFDSFILNEFPKLVLKPRQKYDATPDEKICYDAIIIGAGVVGFATAMYAGRLGLKTLVIGELVGGTITLTHVVENYPGIVSSTGQELAKLMEYHARDYPIHILHGKVNDVSMKKDGEKRLFFVNSKGKTFSTKTIVLATGSQWKKLGVKGEKEYENKGVSYCALCDGPLFKNKILGVVGGGDSAVKEALFLTEFGKKVYIIYRGEQVRPEPVNMQRAEALIKKGKLEIIPNTNIVEIKGNGEQVISVLFDKPYKGKKEFNIDGLFVEIGHVPLSDFAKKLGVNLNDKNEVEINRNSETNVHGFYAAGDVTDTKFKQAITGVGEGVQAAYHVYQYVNKGEYVLPFG